MFARPQLAFVSAAFLLLLYSTASAERAEEPAALKVARAKYERGMREAEQARLEKAVAAHKRHLEALRDLRKSLTEAEKPEDVRKVEDQERRIREQLESDEQQFTRNAHRLSPQANFAVEGEGFQWKELRRGATAYSNRTYKWGEIPEHFRGWQFTQIAGGDTPSMRLKVAGGGVIYAATGSPELAKEGWSSQPELDFRWNEGHDLLHVYAKQVDAGSEVEVPHHEWTGTLILLPPQEARQVAGP